MKKIKFECPCCHETIIITLDEQFQIISIDHIGKNKQVDKKFLEKHNIEFGVVNFNKE